MSDESGTGTPLVLTLAELALAPLDSSDIQLARMWRNDYQIWRWSRQNDFISDISQERWFEQQSKDPRIKMYKIVFSGTDYNDKKKIVSVGICGFTSIDQFCRRAEFSFYIAPGFQKRGFGKRGMYLLLDHGFDNLGFHVIWGEVFKGNPAMALFEKLGFHKEGIRRDFYFKNGQYIDADLISMTEHEWKNIR